VLLDPLTSFVETFESAVLILVWIGASISLTLLLVLVVERAGIAAFEAWTAGVIRRYEPLSRRALDGDDEATSALARMPAHHRITVARHLIVPLISDRDPARIAATGRVVRAMSIVPLADRFLRSRWWWRRALALRALGLIQAVDRAGQIVACLDDAHQEVRGAALDALADLRHPPTLPAIVARLHDASLDGGRRIAALAAFGSEGEPFLLELASVDPVRRLSYARTLAVCGTARARPALCEWTRDTRRDVRAAAFEALAHVGLDERAAALAITALESRDEAVRAMAATALRGWNGPGNAAASLARHLDDRWPVAVSAARTLQSMRAAGRLELEASAMRPGLAGVLARQMLWENGVHT
jgi:HEAT repeat protein